MRIIIILCFLLGATFQNLLAQTFIEKAVIEFEVKTNVKKTMGNSSWAEMLKDQIPQFKTGYYQYTFSGDKSIYKFTRWDEKLKMPEFLKKNDEDNIWYFDHAAGKFNMQKNVFGTNFIVDDSIPDIQWKLTNENRIIAGFNCRKAVGVIMDSVYVFAFYTEEIMIPGGPCSLNGLPGMILGVTIPRLYASWIATKVMVNDVNIASIKPVTSKKPFTINTLQTTIYDRVKEWGDTDDPDSKNWIDQLSWNTQL